MLAKKKNDRPETMDQPYMELAALCHEEPHDSGDTGIMRDLDPHSALDFPGSIAHRVT